MLLHILFWGVLRSSSLPDQTMILPRHDTWDCHICQCRSIDPWPFLGMECVGYGPARCFFLWMIPRRERFEVTAAFSSSERTGSAPRGQDPQNRPRPPQRAAVGCRNELRLSQKDGPPVKPLKVRSEEIVRRNRNNRYFCCWRSPRSRADLFSHICDWKVAEPILGCQAFRR